MKGVVSKTDFLGKPQKKSFFFGSPATKKHHHCLSNDQDSIYLFKVISECELEAAHVVGLLLQEGGQQPHQVVGYAAYCRIKVADPDIFWTDPDSVHKKTG